MPTSSSYSSSSNEGGDNDDDDDDDDHDVDDDDDDDDDNHNADDDDNHNDNCFAKEGIDDEFLSRLRQAVSIEEKQIVLTKEMETALLESGIAPFLSHKLNRFLYLYYQ